MSDEGNRLLACRTCGNRVARDARRCPACGTREPTGAEPAASAVRTPRPAPPAARRRRRGVLLALVLVFVLAAVGMAAVYLTAPVVAPPVPSQARIATPAVEAPVPPPVSSPPPVASRSRGRTDWLFFFKPGDWLTRMADDALLGVVIRVEKTYAFSDGSRGPAYVVQSMEGEERVIDADELERSARLR